ncbi:unnamed protein product [Rhizoctonia solani]|uniref:Uncharacterized protein n=1 Tax=Rhizoctonia solani TaxID=456999 RepID=A0A8H2W8N9_9AGAM|nr:unnamed protein product [Rhizoctonia solani]
MRVKQLWNYVPLPQSLRLVWDRLTLSRLTTLYFSVALVHCFIQVVLQIAALYVNKDATHVLAHIAAIDPDTPTGYAVLSKGGSLRACTAMPGSTGSTGCQMVWSGRVAPDAFGETDPYSYNDIDNQPTSTTTIISSTILAPSSSLLTGPRTSTVLVTASASSTASNTAVQTRTATALPAASSSSGVRSVSRTLSSDSIISTPSAASTPVVPSGGSPTPAQAKRMYIPLHFPESKISRFRKRDLGITPVFSQSNGTFEGVRLRGLSEGNYDGKGEAKETDEAFISKICVHSLQWPLQRLWNTQREDAVFIGFQFWVLGMSLVALLNESVPHIIAAFLTHLLATGWSVFQLVQTATFRSEFNRLTTRGACGGVNLLPIYWRMRIPTLVLNGVVLLSSAYISWRLLKTFGWLTFKRVGASLEINRMYRVVLCLAIVLQLSLYFMVVSMALWIQELYNGPAAKETTLAPLYKAIVAIQLIALVPWLVMGWYAVRREMRKTMIVFLGLSALFIVAWAGMFVSPTWRLTFLTWMFFRMMTVCAAILSVLALVLGIVSFINFGKDLPKHLRMNDDAESVVDFEPAKALENSEKVEFPAQNAFPTFSSAFPSRPDSIKSHSRSDSASSSQSKSSVVAPRMVQQLPPVRDFEVERPMSTVHELYEQDLERVVSNRSNDTYPTIRSTSSGRPVSSDGSIDTGTIKIGKRWIIE